MIKINEKRFFSIVIIFLILLITIIPVIKSINLKINKNQDTSLEKKGLDECKCNSSKVRFKEEKEKNDYYLGLLKGGNPLPPGEEFFGRAPSSWDWRNHEENDWTTSIKDQGKCGSCYAFGIYAAMESCIKIKNNKPNLYIDLSELFMISSNVASVSSIKLPAISSPFQP